MKEKQNAALGTAPLGRLMLKFALPCTVSLLVGALYNIVDQIFIGWGVGYIGNGATNVVFPLTVLALGLAAMIGDCRAHCDSVLSTLGNTCINVTGELRRAENSISSLPAAFNALRAGLEKLEEDK